MKKFLFFTLFTLLAFSGFSQSNGFPGTQLISSGSSRLEIKGAVIADSGTVLSVPFADTATANLNDKIKNTSGIHIRLVNNEEWRRSNDVSHWIMDGSTYTTDNGMTASTPTNFQLGGTLLHNTTVNGTSLYQMNFVSTNSNTGAGGTVRISNNGTGTGLSAFSLNDNAIFAQSINSIAIGAISNTDYAVEGETEADKAALFSSNTTTNNQVVDVLSLRHNVRGGPVGATGLGISIAMEMYDAIGTSSVPASNIVTSWTDPGHFTNTSNFYITQVDGGVMDTTMLLNGNGQMFLPRGYYTNNVTEDSLLTIDYATRSLKMVVAGSSGVTLQGLMNTATTTTGAIGTFAKSNGPGNPVVWDYSNLTGDSLTMVAFTPLGPTTWFNTTTNTLWYYSTIDHAWHQLQNGPSGTCGNIYTLSGTLLSDRILSGASLFYLQLVDLTQFNVQASGAIDLESSTDDVHLGHGPEGTFILFDAQGDTTDVVIDKDNGYLNFGNVGDGTEFNGYGIRNIDGVMQGKNLGGDWQNLAYGIPTLQQVTTAGNITDKYAIFRYLATTEPTFTGYQNALVEIADTIATALNWGAGEVNFARWSTVDSSLIGAIGLSGRWADQNGGDAKTLYLPNIAGVTLVTSVNGVFADSLGNITGGIGGGIYGGSGTLTQDTTQVHMDGKVLSFSQNGELGLLIDGTGKVWTDTLYADDFYLDHYLWVTNGLSVYDSSSGIQTASLTNSDLYLDNADVGGSTYFHVGAGSGHDQIEGIDVINGNNNYVTMDGSFSGINFYNSISSAQTTKFAIDSSGYLAGGNISWTKEGTLTPVNYYSTSSTPGTVAGSGAGTSPTVFIAGTNEGGFINITTGTLPASSSGIITVTFSNSFNFPNNCSVTLYPKNSNTAQLSGVSAVFVSSTFANSWSLTSGSVALAAGTDYSWSYKVEGY